MAITQVYVDPAIAGNSGTGTIGDPYGDLQYALDTQARDATNGDQFNIKAGTAEVLAASLTLATYGTPTVAAPLVLRGYTTTADDGGEAEINCGGFTMFAGNYQNVLLVHLYCHTFGNNNGIALGKGEFAGGLIACRVACGASTPAGKALVSQAAQVTGCTIDGTGGSSMTGVSVSARVTACFVRNVKVGITTADAAIDGNIILLTEAGGTGLMVWQVGARAINGNVVYSTVANTGVGMHVNDASGRLNTTLTNNIVCGFSGAGGRAVLFQGENRVVYGHNAYYNNTSEYASADGGPLLFELGGNVALAADPFVDAANGDFSLTTAAKAALRGVGWPAAYLGAHANTDGHITIGPIQYGEAEAGGGGGGGRRPWLRMHGG